MNVVITVARKPLCKAEGTLAKNAMKHGTGGINIDGTRVGTTDNLNGGAYAQKALDRPDGYEAWRFKRGDLGKGGSFEQPTGRWPANLILVHLPECQCAGTRQVQGPKGSGLTPTPARSNMNASIAGINRVGHADEDGNETVTAWDCQPGCPVAALDEQSGIGKDGVAILSNRKKDENMVFGSGWDHRGLPNAIYGGGGGASRFFKQVQSLRKGEPQ